jgi:hypothetical protein
MRKCCAFPDTDSSEVLPHRKVHAVADMGEMAAELESAALGADRMARSGIGLDVPYMEKPLDADRFSVCRSTMGRFLGYFSLVDEALASVRSLAFSLAQLDYHLPFLQEVVPWSPVALPQ